MSAFGTEATPPCRGFIPNILFLFLFFSASFQVRQTPALIISFFPTHLQFFPVSFHTIFSSTAEDDAGVTAAGAGGRSSFGGGGIAPGGGGGARGRGERKIE